MGFGGMLGPTKFQFDNLIIRAIWQWRGRAKDLINALNLGVGNTNMENSLQRFLDAQQHDYPVALSEIKNGKKHGHWMWYIFPQIAGLGFSETSKFYAIKDIAEAKVFLEHPVLGSRLIAICEALLPLTSNNALSIFGSPDDMKLRSSMTLFSAVPGADPVFNAVLDKFFTGIRDERTMEKIAAGK